MNSVVTFKDQNVKIYFPGNLGSFIFAVISSPCVKFALENEGERGGSLDHVTPEKVKC